ncbi:hypothetical protein vBVhaSVHB1_77 [Vibrio phage vB_VhaS-VHB1]|nr:hypothetical protein vBVhaSVHB1_77 [Vibrio phage vB_VhaS-VHB1]
MAITRGTTNTRLTKLRVCFPVRIGTAKAAELALDNLTPDIDLNEAVTKGIERAYKNVADFRLLDRSVVVISRPCLKGDFLRKVGDHMIPRPYQGMLAARRFSHYVTVDLYIKQRNSPFRAKRREGLHRILQEYAKGFTNALSHNGYEVETFHPDHVLQFLI